MVIRGKSGVQRTARPTFLRLHSLVGRVTPVRAATFTSLAWERFIAETDLSGVPGQSLLAVRGRRAQLHRLPTEIAFP